MILGMLCLSMALVGCRGSVIEIDTPLDDFTVETYPKVDGSTSTQPLQVLVACHVLGATCAWMPATQEARLVATAPVQITVSADAHKTMLNLASTINRRMRHRGTHKAYVNLAEGRADLILVAREPSEDELNLAREKSVEFDARPVALDAFVFIVNRENPIESLTTKNIQDIYRGKTNNWKEVGGPDLELRAFSRERNSGSQQLMEKLVMKRLKMVEAPDMIARGMIGPFSRLNKEKRGLGYSVFFYEQKMAMSQETKLLAVDGVMPTSDSIRARKYAYVSEVYVVARRTLEQTSPAYRLREWLLSRRGQAVVAESGYVPIGVTH